MIDLHCHVIPGIDDGPASARDSLAMCGLMVRDGTEIVVATPHMLNDSYPVSCADILRGVRNLREELEDWGIPLDVRPGADVRVTGDLAERLRAGTVMTVDDAGKYVLLELPHDVIPSGFDELIYEVQVLGITPILSHPERQLELQRRPERLAPLVGRGVLVQVTAASVEGAFGHAARESALQLLRNGMVHLCASDAHSPRGRTPGLSRARKIVEGTLSAEDARRIFDVNPARVLAGEPIESAPAEEEEAVPAKGRRTYFWQR